MLNARTIIAALAVALSTLARPIVAAPIDLLPNGSFERINGEGIEGWTTRAWNGESECSWIARQPGRTGGNAIAIASISGADAAWTSVVTVKPYHWYELSGWIKTQNLQGATGALLNIQNMQSVRTRAFQGTQGWTRVATVFLAETAMIEVNCLFGGWGSSTGQAWFDDVSLKPAALSDIPRDDLHATITIDVDATAVPYSRMLFGGFLEHFGKQIYGGVYDPGSPLSNEQGFRVDVINALKELRVPVVRWPGGCFVSGYHWELGVGHHREPVDDMVWGVIEPNTFGTNEFVELCRLAGWEPYICNNAGNGTIEEMKNWVEYCNANSGRYAQMRRDNGHPEPLGVRIWSIGNENWGQHEIGYKPIEQWAPFVRDAAKSMKAADPHILLSAAALPTREWTKPLLEQAGNDLDYISIHGYWLPLWNNNETPGYLTCMMHSAAPEQMISTFVRVLEETGHRGRIKIAFDEWNLRGWHHPGFPRKTVQDYHDPEVIRLIEAREKNAIHSQYTMADALFSASFLNACLRHSDDVGMANIAPIVNTRGPLFVHPNGVLRRTHFHTLALYASHLESCVGKLRLSAGLLRLGNRSIPVVDAVATVNEAGQRWAVVLINRHPSERVTCKLAIHETPLDGTFHAILLSGDSPDAYNDIEHPDRVVPKKIQLSFQNGAAELPPHSLIILSIP